MTGDTMGDYTPPHLVQLTLEQLREELAYLERHQAQTVAQLERQTQELRRAIQAKSQGRAT
jgi:hypothetical protein